MHPVIRPWFMAVLLLAARTVAASTDNIPAVFEGYFSAKEGHVPGDLITQYDFDQVVGLLEQYGVSAKRFAPLRERIPSDNSYLQRLARTTQGKAFLRKVASTEGYLAIEQLASTNGGEKALKRIISAKGGEDMVRYMATTKGGKKLLKMAPGGKTTKKEQPQPIYTATQLLREMLGLSQPAGA